MLTSLVVKALPYFYVPFPEDISQNPEEGQAFIRILSSAIENTLRLRSFSTSKRQHVYGCSLVKAKKLYGYHSSEELFAKIFLYHPHDITRTARLLLDGSVLGKSLQPYESHIPYLLQFLVDYNLYGMSHIHASKVKFRSPLVYCYNGTSLRPRNILETLDSNTCEKPKGWLSSTVSTTVVWPDFTGSLDSLGNEYAQLIKRQSICQLEADASVEDIVNEKFKIYTSLSQARLDLRMVQSLVPIWEEEYERSGIQEATKQDNPNKLHPDHVLRSFLHGLNYDKTLSELCMKFERMRDQRCAKSCDVSLTCGDTENRSREALSSQSLNKEDLKDNDALQLLYWLASSQAEDEMVTGDELLHEAILSPLMPVNPYSMALEIAYRDYEHASQLECQDILESVESILKLERSEGEASSFLQDHTLNSFDIKSEGSKEHNLSSSQGILDSVSSGACNFQVHGSIDENSKTPQKGNSLEARISYGVEKAIAQPGGIGPMVSSQSKEKKLLGNLPFCPSRSEYGASESSRVAAFSQDEMIDTGFYNPQFHNTEFIQNYGLKTEFGSEICSKNGGMTSGLCSTRDLMRKRRSTRVEPAEAEVQIDEVVPYMFKERPTASVGEGFQLFIEEPFIGHSAILQSVKGTACSTTVCSDIHRREYFEDQTPACRTCTIQNTLSSLCTDKMKSNIVPSEITVVNHRSHLNEHLKNSIVSLNLAVGNSSVLETVPLKMLEVSEVKAVGSVSRALFCRQHRDERPGFPPTLNKCQFKHSENCTGNNALKSIRYKKWNSDFAVNNNNNDPYGSIPHETPIPKMPHNGCQLSTCLSDENCRDFCKEISHEIIEMTFISKPPSNGHILGPDESLPVDQTDGNIVKIQGTKHILPFFPRIFQDANTYDESIFINKDSALGVPIHFQNDGSVLYLLTHAQSPPTLITVCDWLSVQQKHCLLEETGASSCQTSTSAAVGLSQYDSSQSNKQKFSPERKNIYPNIGHISSEAKLDIIPQKVEVLTKNLHDLSQISGPEKYENSNPTPLSQIGFRDSASVGGEQQLTLISLELLAESRGDLRPNPKFDAIKILSLVVQEDTSTASQVYVLIHVINEKPSEINGNGVPDCNMFFFTEEKQLLEQFVDIISYVDPDILMGWETQGCSLGYLTERAVYLGMNMLEKVSRTPFHEKRGITMDLLHSNSFDAFPEATVAKTVLENSVIEDEWASAHASSLQVGGRIVLNIWRLMRSELKLNMYTAEAVAEVVLRQKIPLFSNRTLNQWYSSGIGRARDKCIRYIIERAILNIHIMNQLDMINRTSQLARVFGIDFSSVISRGSQFRVESMLLRLAHTQNYLAISPGYQQVASQPAMECLPLVMEPESGFYSDPVVVLDFQSLYPSMIIAYNLCFCTCLGNVLTASSNTLGVSSYSPDVQILKDFREKLRLTPNGVMYVPPEVRKGLLPRLLEEILSTRIMVKQAMKKLKSSQLVLHKILNARQLALKLISNVTYGYTAAGFSGRMPCAEIADSIVQCGRRTLETAISFVNQHGKWNAKVIYGDTDSMFVLLKGRSKEDAFIIGNEIASVITSMNPEPVALKMEKVYQPCFLLTKKRYVGYSYMNPEQEKPAFDAKGIETVRRDTCPAVAETLERSIRLFFENKNLAEVRSFVERQWTRILSSKISLKDFVFAKEVRLGTYSKASSLPPAAIVAKKAMGIDPRARPHYGERVPYVVVHGEPGSHLIDMVVNPLELLNLNSPFRLNDLYYINKQIIPALQRVFCFFGADMHQWFSAVPRPTRPMLTKCNALMLVSKSFNEDNKGDPTVAKKPQAKRIRIDAYYSLKHCYLCDGDLIQSSEHFCVKCLNKMSMVAAAVSGRTSKREREIQHLNEICRHCGGGDWIVENGVKCISLTCSVTYERQKVLKELQFHSSFSTNAGFYPPCNVELF